jgi:large subunit ribosomal protein L7/L12
MAVSKEDILETISNMSVMEVVDLISAMEEKFGVSAAAAVAVAAGPAAGAEAAAALSRLSSTCWPLSGRRRPGDQRLRDHGLGLKEAGIWSKAPSTVKEGFQDRCGHQEKLEEAGATVEVINLLPGFGIKKWVRRRSPPVPVCISNDLNARRNQHELLIHGKKRIRKDFGKRRSILEVPHRWKRKLPYAEFLQLDVPAEERRRGLHGALKSIFLIVICQAMPLWNTSAAAMRCST